MKYYFENTEAENCYPRQHFLDQMKESGVAEMTIYPAIMSRGEDFFFCVEYGEPGETRECCGKQCDSYDPRNHKNGRCRFHRNCYEPSEDKPVVLKIPKLGEISDQHNQDLYWDQCVNKK
jgi:hypothetical protein